jgi:hypothetical protein
MTDIELLRAVIDASGLPDKRWAQLVAWRDRKTIERWLNGTSAIPSLVVENLAAIHQRNALKSA